jgi:small subunit ribosomal protein S4e
MTKNHIKRLNAPRRWDILRKDTTFISRPNPGRDLSMCISLNTVLKDMLGKADNTKESKYIIKYRGVLVNGVRRYDEKFPVGFLDVVSFPELKESYRLLVNDQDKLFLHKVPDSEANLKLSKISDKKQIKKGAVQINCGDGRNFLFKSDDAVLKEAGLNDSVVYSLPEQKFKNILKMEKGALVYLYKGKHTGLVVNIEDYKQNNILFKLDGDLFETKRAYAFVIGKDSPIISIPEWEQTHAKNNDKKEYKEQKEHKESVKKK